MRLAVVTPWSSPFIWTKFTENLANLLAAFRRPEWAAHFFMGRGCDPAARHVDMCQQGLDWGADVLCIIGADQVHPLDMLNRLLDRYYATGGGVISALVPFRGFVAGQGMTPFQPMGWRIRSGKGGLREFQGLDQAPDMFEPIDPKAGDLQRIDVIGSGVLLFDRAVLEALKPPWFYYHVDPITMQRVADMDSRFVWRLRDEVQVDVWCDTTIKVKHIHPFEIDDTWQARFADWVEPGQGDGDIIKHATA
jgi:hypothetical protein